MRDLTSPNETLDRMMRIAVERIFQSAALLPRSSSLVSFASGHFTRH
jgi:hypothetical protein